ncbi:YeiH family protein [Consotaella aegiceratis]|uniref:YeiH family protein n=1 Tax=Consotaella aegiceratis TaxID=3097961 RepID=UPI002F3E6ADF
MRLLPGLALAAGIAALALGLRSIIGIAALSPLILSIVLGMIVANTVGTPTATRPGLTFSLRRILRFAIILLGLQLTMHQIAEVGATGLAIVAVTLVSTFLFTKAMGRVLGVERKLAELIAAGTSVCGASAVIATNTVTGGSDEDVAYAVACVTVFGSLAMLVAPVVAEFLALDPVGYGLWTGATIHEVAQVVAAAFQGGDAAGHFGTIVKLSRVLMLAPLILTLGFLSLGRREREGRSAKGAPIPWFVFGFLALVAVNSVVDISSPVHDTVAFVASFLLSMALAAMGLDTHIGRLKQEGLRPALLGLLAWLFIAGFGLGAVELTGL